MKSFLAPLPKMISSSLKSICVCCLQHSCGPYYILFHYGTTVVHTWLTISHANGRRGQNNSKQQRIHSFVNVSQWLFCSGLTFRISFPYVNTESNEYCNKVPWVTLRWMSGPLPYTITYSLFKERLEHPPLLRLLCLLSSACKAGLPDLVVSPCVHTLLKVLSWGSETAADESCRAFLLPVHGWLSSNHRGQDTFPPPTSQWPPLEGAGVTGERKATWSYLSLSHPKPNFLHLQEASSWMPLSPSSPERQAGFPTMWDIWGGRKVVPFFPTKASASWGLRSYKWVNKWRPYLLLISADTGEYVSV